MPELEKEFMLVYNQDRSIHGFIYPSEAVYGQLLRAGKLQLSFYVRPLISVGGSGTFLHYKWFWLSPRDQKCFEVPTVPS